MVLSPFVNIDYLDIGRLARLLKNYNYANRGHVKSNKNPLCHKPIWVHCLHQISGLDVIQAPASLQRSWGDKFKSESPAGLSGWY